MNIENILLKLRKPIDGHNRKTNCWETKFFTIDWRNSSSSSSRVLLLTINRLLNQHSIRSKQKAPPAFYLYFSLWSLLDCISNIFLYFTQYLAASWDTVYFMFFPFSFLFQIFFHSSTWFKVLSKRKRKTNV